MHWLFGGKILSVPDSSNKLRSDRQCHSFELPKLILAASQNLPFQAEQDFLLSEKRADCLPRGEIDGIWLN